MYESCFALLLCGAVAAQASTGSGPAAEPKAEPIWKGDPPGSGKVEGPEKVANRTQDRNSLGLNRSFSNVSVPTIATYLPPKAKATAAAGAW